MISTPTSDVQGDLDGTLLVVRVDAVVEAFPAFVVGSPKGDLGHLGDLLPKRGLLKVTFLFKSLLSKRKDDRDVLHTSFAAHKAELFLR